MTYPNDDDELCPMQKRLSRINQMAQIEFLLWFRQEKPLMLYEANDTSASLKPLFIPFILCNAFGTIVSGCSCKQPDHYRAAWQKMPYPFKDPSYQWMAASMVVINSQYLVNMRWKKACIIVDLVSLCSRVWVNGLILLMRLPCLSIYLKCQTTIAHFHATNRQSLNKIYKIL